MQALLEHFITQSTVYSLMAVVLVAFLESLALVGLILPGTVLMAGLGALIGSGELSFWHAWLAGIVGCLLGDWISFWLGWRFKKPLHRWSFLKKNKALLDKTEHALHQHSMFTILVGRFVGPTRPLVPMVAGMLDLPVAKFITPNIIGCLLWPPFYFLPGILAGAAIDIPAGMQSGEFKWLLLATAVGCGVNALSDLRVVRFVGLIRRGKRRIRQPAQDYLLNPNHFTQNIDIHRHQRMAN